MCLNSPRVRLILVSLFATALYGYDVISDVLLAVAYSREANHTMEFGLTTAYIVAPTILCNAICAYFIRVETSAWTTEAFFQLILTFPFLLGPLVRHAKAIIRACRGKETQKVEAHTALIILLEGYFESASQLILQLYLSIVQDHHEELSTRILRSAAMVGSGIGLAWSLVSVRRTNRLQDQDEDNDETLCGSIVYFLAKVCEVGPRVVLMALFASHFTFYAFILGAGHWIICSLWIFIIDKTRERKSCINIILKILIGYPLIFCFVDLDYVYTETEREHIPTRYKMMLYYLLFYTENWLMFALWITTMADTVIWFYPVSIAIVAGGMVLHIIFQIIYYKGCHPGKENIPILRKFTLDSCLYHDDEESKVV
ncbi:hypothetical protein FSP39_002260 [Pinctada imbricata]|uniref:XK-related protein n=1 Tax=Pinctada imbricata TaxID=66713 RepID=A0AA88XTC0_PINIB|nr:hypothetical protein FSP39_002260 [Pinctada imbricata]